MAKQRGSMEELRLRALLGEIRRLADGAEGVEPKPAMVATPLPVAVSVEQAAGLMSVAPSTLSEYIRSGRLPAFRLGRRLLIRLDSLHAFAEGLERAEAGGCDESL